MNSATAFPLRMTTHKLLGVTSACVMSAIATTMQSRNQILSAVSVIKASSALALTMTGKRIAGTSLPREKLLAHHATVASFLRLCALKRSVEIFLALVTSVARTISTATAGCKRCLIVGMTASSNS